jgi:hypothetical protein
MKIVESPTLLYFEGRTIPPRAWYVWGGLFLPGMAALLLVPEASRFIGLVVWMAIWLGLFYLVSRWLGVSVRVTIDAKKREIVWRRNGEVTRALTFAEVRQFDIQPITVPSRPYKAFQLIAALKNDSRITLAVDPREAEIQRALKLARERFR